MIHDNILHIRNMNNEISESTWIFHLLQFKINLRMFMPVYVLFC